MPYIARTDLPVGTILDWPVVGAEGKWPDAGQWKECDGSAISKTSYADLWILFGSHIWGADPGGGNFCLPDFGRRVTVGRKTTGTPDMNLGKMGGAETCTLDATMIPSHTHTVSGSWGTALTKGCCSMCSATSGTPVNVLTCSGTGLTTSTITPANTGGGLAHSILPPFAAVCKLIKVKKAA